MVLNVPDAKRTSTRGDLVAAYAATGAKVLSWAVAAAVVYRHLGEAAFAVLAMTRATLGLLNYTTFGLGPAVIHFTSRATATPIEPVDAEPVEDGEELTYEPVADWKPPVRRGGDSPASVLRHANVLLIVTWTAALAIGIAYGSLFGRIHEVPAGVDDIASFVFWFAVGLAARLASDCLGGASQALGRLAVDQWLLATGDGLWAVLLVAIAIFDSNPNLASVGITYALSGIAIFALRRLLANHATRLATGSAGREPVEAKIDAYFLGRLVAYGGLVTLGSAADFLYAPIDYFILNRLVDPLAPAVYAPAVQIDAAILILTTAIATVALPSSARLHTAGDAAGVWRQYLRGSLLAGGVAIAAAVPAWLLSPWVFELWLGDDLPATRAILPLVLLHTILGSAAGVGRATLLAVGRAGTYAIVVLLGGLLNVLVSLALVWAGLGVAGVVIGTVVSVAARCLIALPILVRQATRG